jgi:transcriptional regulator with XRE-family HTH domain
MNQSTYLRSLFKTKNILIKDVAEKIGITPNNLSIKISGKRNLKINEINIILDSLNMTYEEVFRVENINIERCDNR